MLQNLHEKSRGLVAWFIILFIAGAFVFFGVTEYFSFGKTQDIAAKVNGEKISWAAVELMYDRLSRQYSNQIDAASLKDQIRMRLVERAALMSNAKNLGFRVNDEQVAKALVQIPAFQENGKFSKELYLKILKEASYTDIGFRHELAHDILLSQLEQGLVISSFTMPLELKKVVALIDQKRDIGYFIIPSKSFEKGITVSEADAKKYYENQKNQFVKPEEISLQYIELSLEDFAKQVSVPEQDAVNYYKEHKESFSAPERVRARHILIDSKKSEAEASKKAKEKADNILAQIKKNPSSFAKLAKENSIDSGSAAKGGDLGWFTRGQMIPEFEKAAFALKRPNEVSQVVETKFGYHIIQLVEHKNAEVRPFAEIKAHIIEQLKREKAQALFAKKAEELAKLAFEQSNTLTPVAEKLGLKLQETPLFSRESAMQQQQTQQIAAQSKGAAISPSKAIESRPEVLNVAFTAALIKEGHNSELIRVSETSSVIIRVKSHVDAKQQSFEEVTKQIQAKLAMQRAREKAKTFGEQLAKRILNKENPQDIAKQEKLQWKTYANVMRMQQSPDLDRTIVLNAFQIPSENVTESKPGVLGLVLPNGEFAVLAVTKLKDGDISKVDTGTLKAYLQGLTEASAQLEFALYARQTLNESKVEMIANKDPGVDKLAADKKS